MKGLFKKFCFSLLLIFSFSFLSAQNVAINTSGAVANSSAMLDISSTNSGLLVPRMTTAQRTAIGAPATGLLVYDTNFQAFWFYDGTVWRPLLANNTGWALAGNTLGGTEILGSVNAQPLRIFTNNTERMRVNATGEVGIGTVATGGYSLHIVSAGTYSAYASNSGANNDVFWGINTAAAGAGGSAGVVGICYQSGVLAAGVWGENPNAGGTGVVGVANGTGAIAFAGGAGGTFHGVTTGVFARSSTAGTGQSVYCDQFGDVVRVAHYNGTFYKIIGVGTVSTVVPDLQNNWVTMHAPESPEFYYTDYGQGQLVNGVTHIELDPVFAKNVMISEKHPLRVFIQLEDNEFCKGVVIKNKTATGFDVVELEGGTSNTPFQWNVVCNAGDLELPSGRISKFADIRFEPTSLPLQDNSPGTTNTKVIE